MGKDVAVGAAMHTGSKGRKRTDQRGFTLIEMMIACVVLLVGIVGVLSAFGVAIVQTSTQGDQATRTAEYAQDKMEQLMALEYADSQSDATQPITAPTGGVGLTAGGSTSTPTTGYADYVDNNGVASSAKPATVTYTREWTISEDTTLKIKTITVKVTANSGYPTFTLVSQKCSY
jgi:prepilin-type N-terminal cleavage/methylation domain-containing protein